MSEGAWLKQVLTDAKAEKVNVMNKIEITQHYEKDDKQFHRDYLSIDMKVTLDSRTHSFHFGDAYHDKGDDKVEGAFEVLKKFFGPIELVRAKKASGKL